MRWVLTAIMLAGGQGAAAQAAQPAVPSGQPLELMEALEERGAATGPILRYRYLAPDLGGQDFAAVEADMAALCAALLPELPDRGPDAAGPTPQIVISMADARIAFGVRDPDIRQIFELFRVEDGRCIWEAF